jgi:hypothetical protein
LFRESYGSWTKTRLIDGLWRCWQRMNNLRVFNGNYRFHVYKGRKLVYNGNSRFIAGIYRLIERFDKNYYVGDLNGTKSR